VRLPPQQYQEFLCFRLYEMKISEICSTMALVRNDLFAKFAMRHCWSDIERYYALLVPNHCTFGSHRASKSTFKTLNAPL
jgi:hypothetical protein